MFSLDFHALAYAGLVGLRGLDQHRTNRWQVRWTVEQNDVGLISFVNVGRNKMPTKCNVDPTSLGC